MQMLKSNIDDSVNFVLPAAAGYFECRYVRRTPEYFVCYLSAQSGCRQACRMCHLTATKQTQAEDAGVFDIEDQARTVLDYYVEHIQAAEPAKVVHFSFMARGEPLANKWIWESHAEQTFSDLYRRARRLNLYPRFCISTILPKTLDKPLVDLFGPYQPDLYYSIYSTSESFRKKWLPNALPVDEGLSKLVEYQQLTRKLIRLHWAFIEGENDSEEDVQGILRAVQQARLRVDVNIVRYNPYSPLQGKEPSEDVVQRLVGLIREELPESAVKAVDRVGFDVKASCGMFVGAK